MTDSNSCLFTIYYICLHLGWFEKVAVSQGRVFGLLNRRCLFAWNADTGDHLLRLDLTELAPGLSDANPHFMYLTVYKNMFATIHQSPSCQAVYEIVEDNSKVNAIMLDMDMNYLKLNMGSPAADMRVCDVYMNDHVLILHVVNCKTKSYEAIFLRLDTKLDFESVFLEYQKHRKIGIEPISDSIPGNIAMTATKFLNITPNRLFMYDFLK